MAQHLSGPAILDGQVALLTGGAGGMGRVIAAAFHTAGARVVATARGEHENLGPGYENDVFGELLGLGSAQRADLEARDIIA